MIRLLMRRLRLRPSRSRVRIGGMAPGSDENDDEMKIDTNDKSPTTNLMLCLRGWYHEIC